MGSYLDIPVIILKKIKHWLNAVISQCKDSLELNKSANTKYIEKCK